MTEARQKSLCCTSPRSLCYWGVAFVIFYAAGLALVFLLHGATYKLVVLFVALGLACIVNFARNRTFHCLITGPFFFLIAAAFGLRASGIWMVSVGVLWMIVAIVVCASFLLERRFAS
jgi:hypothetical protein